MKSKSGMEATAYHEAGHAVMAWHVGETPRNIAIGAPRPGVTGVTSYELPMALTGELDPRSDKARLIAERAILVSLAGPAAQRRYRVTSWRRAHSKLDESRAQSLAAAVTESPRQAAALLRFLRIRADDILAARWTQVCAIAQRLIDQSALCREEIVATLTDR